MILPNKTNDRRCHRIKGVIFMATTQTNMACSMCLERMFNLGKTTTVKDFIDINNFNFCAYTPTYNIVNYPLIHLCDDCLVDYKERYAFFKAYVV